MIKLFKNLKNISQDELKNSIAEALPYIENPEKGVGTKLFDALAKVTVNVAIEAVCLRINPNTKEVEVYMTQRSQTDTAYPGEWHCPGSIMRPKEEIEDVFSRLEKKEFDSLAHFDEKRFVANVNHSTEARGHFLSIVYLCELVFNMAGDMEGSHLKGKWFSINNLPEKTVESHVKRIIPTAVGAFVAESTKICL